MMARIKQMFICLIFLLGLITYSYVFANINSPGVYISPKGTQVQIFPRPTPLTPLGTMSDWNQRVDNTQWVVASNSDKIINTIGANKPLHPDFGRQAGIPFNILESNLTDEYQYIVHFTQYGDESAHGVYMIPKDAKIEGNGTGDAHVLVLDVNNHKLYELYLARYNSAKNRWVAASGVIWDLNSNALWGPNYPQTKPPQGSGWTSADAAGLPIFPGLLRYAEFYPLKGQQAGFNHALRFTAPRTRKKFIPPAVHQAGHETASRFPPMGMRVRLKQDLSSCGIHNVSDLPEKMRILIKGLQQYGMILADNGGPWFISGEQNPNWPSGDAIWWHFNDGRLLKGKCFEVVCPKDQPDCTL